LFAPLPRTVVSAAVVRVLQLCGWLNVPQRDLRLES
jgi:hypothetical protein